MNPFLPGDGTVPDPASDIPVFESPPADFSSIGKALQDGAHASWANVLKDVQCGTGTGPKQSQTWGDIIQSIWNGNFLFCWMQKLVAWFVASFFDLLAWIMGQMFQVLETGKLPMNKLFSTVVNGMFGIGGASIAPGPSGLPTQDAAVAKGIASTIAGALRAGVPASGSGGIQPSSAGADKFLEMAAHMAIEGWLLGWVTDALSVHELEQIGDLKDTLERTLGVGRLARRALHAPMKIFVEDPYMQLLHQTYQPTLLSPGELVRQYLRDPTQKATYYTNMALHGYNSDRAASLILDGMKTLPLEDVYHLKLIGKYTEEQAVLQMAYAGYASQDALDLFDALDNKRVEGLNRKLVEEALSLFRAAKITRAQFDTVAQSSGLPEPEPDIFGKLADLIDSGHKQCKVQECKRPSLAEGLQMLERNIWTQPQYEDLLNYYNYQPADEFDLATLAKGEALDWQALQGQKAQALQDRQKRAADRLKRAQMMVEDIGVSTAEMETLVYEGLRSVDQYKQYLRNKSVAEDNVQALAVALNTKLIAKAAAAAAKLAAKNKAKVKNVDLAQLETAVKQGLMTLPDFITRVKNLGMSDADAQLIEQELKNSMDAAATKAQAVAAAKAKAAEKHVDLSQMERAVRLGIVSMNDYQAFLVAHGFTAEEQGILMMTLQDQLTSDQQTAAKKKAAAAKAAQKGIALPQLERLVRAGVKTIGDYTSALATAGYDAADQASLTQFLQLQMEQDQQSLVVHGHAAALVDQMGVSLADLERAVKLSVVPIATYQDALQRAGISGPDQQTLVANLAAQIKATRAQQSTTASVAKQVAAAGLSLASLEKDVVSGKISIDQFEGLLNGYNVAAADVADVVALVQDQIDNKKAVDALVAQAGARAAAKGLDLAQDTAAYKAGVMTEADWRTRVASLGYDAADVEILFETLAAKQAATAAKSATKRTTTPANGTAAGISAPVLQPLPTPTPLP